MRHGQPDDSFHVEFSVDRKSTKRLRKLLACGASSSDSRALRERYEPKFGSSSFQLKAPSLDSSMKRRLIAVRNGNNARSQTTRLNDPMEKSLTEIQLKIMDGIRPLLHLKSELDRLGASRSLKRAASTALSLVGNAFSEVTKRRRLNVLRQTDGRFVSLLEEKDRFSVREGGDLFGRHFLRSMVRTAREEENLRSMSRSGGHSIRAPSNFNRGRTAFGGRVNGRFHSSGRSGIYPGSGPIDNQRGSQKGASGSGASDALLAEPSMVPSCPGAHKRHPGNSASNRSPVDIGHRRDTSADQVEIPHLSRLETLRKRFREQGLSEEVAQLLLDGNRQSTSAAYEAGWALWGDWCRQKHSDPLSNDLNSILQFLSEAFLKGKSYSSVNILRSMLSVTLEQINGKGVGSHPLIIRLMKGIFLNKPPKPRYVATWNVDGALKFVSDLGDNANLSLLDLSKKLVFLLSLSTFARVSELASISRNSVQFSEWGSTFSLSKLRKSQRSGALPVVRVEKFTGDPRLCPVTCMKDYIQATDGLVDGRFGDGLLIASRKPFKPIGASTVARWIKSLLKEAGVDVSTFSAHSTRGAASSKAFNKGLSVETILKTGNWSTESVFSRFYKRVSNSESVVDVVLSVTND